MTTPQTKRLPSATGKPCIATIVGICLVVLGIHPAAAMIAISHPIHSSIAEAEWNPDSQRFEVALKLNGLELEHELSALENRSINVETTPNAEEIVCKYVTGRLSITTGTHTGCRLHWVGMDVEIKDVWLYFELQPVISDASDNEGRSLSAAVNTSGSKDRLDGASSRTPKIAQQPMEPDASSTVSLEQIKLHNALLLTSRPEQINLVTLIIEDKHHSVHFTAEQKDVSLPLAAIGTQPNGPRLSE